MGLGKPKLLIEAPVNGGRNYNGPKVENTEALERTRVKELGKMVP